MDVCPGLEQPPMPETPWPQGMSFYVTVSHGWRLVRRREIWEAEMSQITKVNIALGQRCRDLINLQNSKCWAVLINVTCDLCIELSKQIPRLFDNQNTSMLHLLYLLSLPKPVHN